MPTFEEFGVLLNINDQIYRLVRNMQANANDYKAKALAGFDAAKLAAIMQGDADQFLKRLQTVTDVTARKSVTVQNALAIIGLTLSDVNATKATLATECQYVKSATFKTVDDCTAVANHILANIPSYDGLY